MSNRIAGFASFVKDLSKLCRTLDKYSSTIRAALPSTYHTQYDSLVVVVNALCAIVKVIDLIGDNTGSQ